LNVNNVYTEVQLSLLQSDSTYSVSNEFVDMHAFLL